MIYIIFYHVNMEVQILLKILYQLIEQFIRHNLPHGGWVIKKVQLRNVKR